MRKTAIHSAGIEDHMSHSSDGSVYRARSIGAAFFLKYRAMIVIAIGLLAAGHWFRIGAWLSPGSSHGGQALMQLQPAKWVAGVRALSRLA
jgi:hypothetical protein